MPCQDIAWDLPDPFTICITVRDERNRPSRAPREFAEILGVAAVAGGKGL